MSRFAVFVAAHDGFAPGADDPVENVPFYRVAAGLVAAWELDGLSGPYHQVACEATWGGRMTAEEHYSAACATLRALAIDGVYREASEPQSCGGWASEPVEPTEREARAFFNAEYKRAFPGKRANSKRANGLWKEKQAQCVSILRERYESEMGAYRERRARIAADDARIREEWLGGIHYAATFEDKARAILDA